MTTPLQVQICSLSDFDHKDEAILTLSCGSYRRPYLLSRDEVRLLYYASERVLKMNEDQSSD